MIEKLIRERDITIPNLLFYNYKKLNITAEEVLFLTYLMNNVIFFNPKKISEDLSMSLSDVMSLVEHLTSLKFVSIELKKINNIRTEVIDLNGFYDKLIDLLSEEKEEEPESTIYDVFEKEFGRTLSPMEYEIINTWKDNNLSEELIILALKEAVYNGVNNLRYIDRILNEWQKKGIKNEEDLQKDKEIYAKKRIDNKQNFENTDYDWLNDEE